MNKEIRILILFTPTMLGVSSHGRDQFIKSIELVTARGLGVASYTAADGRRIECNGTLPFFTFELIGVMDLIGNVWQLTNDVYDNGSYYFGIIREGSYYNPTASVWYIEGGPQAADKPQILLMISPGFDRNATVGFRCVKEAK